MSKDLESAIQRSVAQLLFKASRLVNERAIERVRERLGAPTLRVAHTTLFPHIDLEGTRLTVLAQRLEVSKQAAAQLVDELVEMDMLERVPDPDDGRAKLIRFCQGDKGILRGLAVLSELEAEIVERIGERRFADLHRSLAQIVEIMDR